MFRSLRIASAAVVTLGLGLFLSGCNTLNSAVQYIASPTFTQAVANAKGLAQAFDCGIVVTGAALSEQIASLVNAGKAAIDDTGKVYGVSEDICVTLGGTPSSTPVTLPAGTAGATVVIPATPGSTPTVSAVRRIR